MKKTVLSTNDRLVNRLIKAEAKGISSTRFNNKPIFWKKASGCVIEDFNGNKYLDCTSSYGVMGIGYSHPQIINSIENQIKQLNHTMCEIFPHEQYLLSLENIKSALHREQDQVTLTVTGSDAIDVAIKLSMRYTGKSGIISFSNCFHGQTLGVLSVTDIKEFKEPFKKIINDDVYVVPYPNTYRNPFSTEDILLEATIDNINKCISESKDNIGAILVEPMQNASGYIIPPKEFLKEIRKLCNRKSILMIVDEIFTGFGRCGEWLLSNTDNIEADILCVGKVMTSGFPGAACLASPDIMKSLDYPGLVPLHGSTYTGNAITCSAINSTIQVLKDENLIYKSKSNGEILRALLRDTLMECENIGDIRGLGSATMIEFVSNKSTKEPNSIHANLFSDFLKEKSILTLVSGLPYCNCVAICPPFTISHNQIDYIIEACKQYRNVL